MEICGTKSGCKLEGRLKGLDAGMQQPTACRKYEGDRVRRVGSEAQRERRVACAPLVRGSPARGLRIGQSRGSEARGGGEERGVLVGGGARLRKGTRKNHSHETKGDACVLPECQQAPWRKAPERTRRFPCARAVRCARAGLAPTHTLSTASDGARRRRVVERVSVLQALLKGRALGVRDQTTWSTVCETLDAGLPPKKRLRELTHRVRLMP